MKTAKEQREQRARDLEFAVMVHRYLYYVLAQPVLPDVEYDKLEREARELNLKSSPVHKVGSSLARSYSDDVKIRAAQILKAHGY